MARGGFTAAPNSNPDPPDLSLLRAKNGLDNGVHFKQQFKSYAGSVVALEAGTHSGWVSRVLKQMGLETVVANPRKVRLIAESTQKSDPEDARMLARLARVDRKLLFEIHHRSEAAQLDLTVIRARAGLVEARTKLVNSLRGLTKTLGSRLRKCDAGGITVEVLEGLPEAVKEALTPLVVQIQSLTVGIEEYDQRIAAGGKQYPEIERLKQEWTEVSAAEKADFQQQWEELSAKATTLAAARDRLLKENAGMREQLSRAIKPQAKLKADIIPRKGPGSEPPPAA